MLVQSPAEPELDGAQSLDSRAWRWIWIACAVGAAVRIAILITKWNKGLLLNDSLYYSSQARQNAEGRWFRDALGGNPGAEHAPLTSLLLTPSSLLSPHEFWQRATNTLIGIATIPFIGRLTLEMAGRRAGVVAAFIAALYPNLWMNDGLIMSETISTFTVVLALWFAMRHVQRYRRMSALWCGLAVGLAALARSEVLLFAPLFALVGVRTCRIDWAATRTWLARAAVLVVSAIALLVPWSLYNLGRFDAPVLVSTNAGGALLGANCVDVYYGPALGGWSWPCLLFSGEREGEDAAERSVRWQREAIDYAREHADRIPAVVTARLLRAADLYGLRELVLFDVGEERMRWASWAGIVSWWVLAPVAGLGWFRQARRYRWITLCPVIGVIVTTALFYGGHRLRSPLEPVVVICAAIGFTSLTRVRTFLDRWVSWPDR